MFENGKQVELFHGAGLFGPHRGAGDHTGLERRGCPPGTREVCYLACLRDLAATLILHLCTAGRKPGCGEMAEETLPKNEKKAAIPFSNNIQGHSSRGPFYLQAV